MNPYKIDYKKLEESKEIKSNKAKLKLKLVAAFLKATANMDSSEIIEKIGLDKSDLSRLRSLNISRFTIDRLIGFLELLGFVSNIDIKQKKVV